MAPRKNCTTIGWDIALVVDTSSSIGQRNFELVRGNLIKLSNAFKGYNRVAIIIYPYFGDKFVEDASCEEKTDDDFKKCYTANFEKYVADYQQTYTLVELTNSTQEVQDKVMKFRYIGGNTPTHVAINHTVRALKSGRTHDLSERALLNNRRSIMVVFTDGQSEDPESTKSMSMEAQSEPELVTYSVGIGNNTTRSELDYISGNPNRTFTTENLDTLRKLIEPSGDLLCPW